MTDTRKEVDVFRIVVQFHGADRIVERTVLVDRRGIEDAWLAVVEVLRVVLCAIRLLEPYVDDHFDVLVSEMSKSTCESFQMTRSIINATRKRMKEEDEWLENHEPGPLTDAEFLDHLRTLEEE